MSEISRLATKRPTRWSACALALGALVACSSHRTQQQAAAGPGGLSVDEANTLGQKCKALVDQATSYHVPNQLPEYYGAACIENFIAKQSVSSVVAAGEDKGITVTDADARDYLKGHADACAQNVENAKALFSGSPVVDGAPDGFMALIDEMVAQIRLQKPVADSSIGPVMLDCEVADVGGGGTSTGTSSNAPPDLDLAVAISDALNRGTTLLWNRDINDLESATPSASGACTAGGDYSATGTRTWLNAGCEGTASSDLRFDMTACGHESAFPGVRVTFTGAVQRKVSGTFAGSCDDVQEQTTTLTGKGLTVVYERDASAAGGAFQKTFHACDVEVLYVMKAGQNSTLAGRACGIPFSI